jgi:threonine aldolase
MIELRSDTFTLPSPRMYERIASAPLGDDGYGEDPTVRELESKAAAAMGQPSACLVASGTMGNLCGVLAHTDRGQAAIVGNLSDIYRFEAGGLSVLGAVVLRPVRNNPDGTLDEPALTAELAADRDDPQFAHPAVVCLETTHGLTGGTPLDPGYIAAVARLAARHGAALHLDGARIFNAAVALGIPVAEIGRLADTVSFCLSKGLGAPVGSVVAGPADTIARVRRIRKMLGGTMRQAGIIAAAGLVAIDSPERMLLADHRNAAEFADLIAAGRPITVLHPVLSNMVFFRVGADGSRHAEFLWRCLESGLALTELLPGQIRAVFHKEVKASDVVAAAKIVLTAAAGL